MIHATLYVSLVAAASCDLVHVACMAEATSSNTVATQIRDAEQRDGMLLFQGLPYGLGRLGRQDSRRNWHGHMPCLFTARRACTTVFRDREAGGVRRRQKIGKCRQCFRDIWRNRKKEREREREIERERGRERERERGG